MPDASNFAGQTPESGVRSLCPETNLIMQIAWRDCLLWSINSTEPDFLMAFKSETGYQAVPPRNILDKLIDKATGYNDAVALAYIKWFNEKVWGPGKTECRLEVEER